jgi:hypothetical protein
VARAADAERLGADGAIVFENFTGAIGTVIFVAYLSALCRNPLHTATQYALLTALASTGRTLLSSGTGYHGAAHRLVGVLRRHRLAALPALVLLSWLQRRRHFAASTRSGAVRWTERERRRVRLQKLYVELP